MATNGDSPAHRRLGCDEVVVIELARGRPYAEIAETAGVSLRTVERRAVESETVATVGRLRAEMLDRAAAGLLDSLDDAVEALRSLLRSENEATRLKAAVAVLDQARVMRELHSIDRRLRAVEDATQEHRDRDHTRWSA